MERRNKILFAGMIVALCLPIINTIYNTELVYSDENYYKMLANEINNGNKIPRVMPQIDGDVYQIYRSPFYPAIVSIFDKWTSFLFYICIISFSWFFYRKNISEKGYPYLTFFVLMTIPIFFVMTMISYMETFTTFLILGSSYFLIMGIEGKNYKYSAFSGIFVSIFFLGKEIAFLYMAILILTSLLLYRKRALKPIMILILFSLIGASWYATNVFVFDNALPHKLTSGSLEFNGVDTIRFFEFVYYPQVFFSLTMIASTIGVFSLIILIISVLSKNKKMNPKNRNILIIILMWSIAVFPLSQWRYFIPLLLFLTLNFVPHLSIKINDIKKRYSWDKKYFVMSLFYLLLVFSLLSYLSLSASIVDDKTNHENDYLIIKNMTNETDKFIATEGVDFIHITGRNVTWVVWFYFNEDTLDKIDVDYIYIHLPSTAKYILNLDTKIKIIDERNDTTLIFNKTNRDVYNMLYKVEKWPKKET